MSGGTFGWQGETLEFPAGVDSTRVAGVSPAGRARLRYNDVSKELEVSLDGGAYQVLSTGSDSPWVESPPGVVRLITPSNDVVIGGLLPVNGAQLTVIGEEASPQLRLQSDNQDSWIQLAPTVVASGHPPMNIRAANVLFNGVEDQVLVVGHNAGPTGRQDDTKVGAWWQIEYNFKTGPGVGDPIFTEFLLQWFSAAGVGRRPITAVVNWTDNSCIWGLTGGGVITDSAGVQTAGMGENGFLSMHLAGGGFHKVGNNTGILWADKTTLTHVELLRVFTDNTVWMDANQNFTGWQILSPGGLYIGPFAANASAKLQVDSTTKGFLPPRMTTGERDAIAAPAAGLIIYNTTTNKLNLRVAAAWEVITSA